MEIVTGAGTHFKTHNMEIDHIIAKSVGGTDHIDNLQLLCSRCNRLKGNRGAGIFIGKTQRCLKFFEKKK